MTVRLEQLFAGQLQPLDGVGDPTGLYKQPIQGSMPVLEEGLIGDRQADRRHHGGPERALNHYPAEHYDHWAQQFPSTPEAFAPGVFGENLSTRGMTEENVHLGDIYRLGGAVIQVTQPRSPCWKIARRMNIRELAVEVAQAARSGWLYRVVETGEIAAGDHFGLIQRPLPDWPLVRLWRLRNDSDAALDELRAAASIDVLGSDWRSGYANRVRNAGKRRRGGDQPPD